MERNGRLLGAFVVGLLAGAGAALLLAPASGEETRKRIRDAGESAVERVRDVAARGRETVRAAYAAGRDAAKGPGGEGSGS